MATIKDIADKLGVSIATVSYVMNGKKKISPDMEQLVLKTAKEMNYYPHQNAKSLATGSSKIIVIIVNDLMDSFFSALARGAEDSLRKAGYVAIVGSMNESSKVFKEYLNLAMSFNAAGMILSPPNKMNDIDFILQGCKIPIVQVNRYSKQIDSDVVETDNFNALYMVTMEVIKKNHKRICLVAGPKNLSTYGERIRGFKKALEENGLYESNKDLIIQSKGTDFDSGYKLFNKVFEMEDKPTAIIGGGSDISKGIYKAIIDRDLKIGEDISFIGYDISGWSYLLKNPVFEVSQDIKRMGQTAVEILLERIDKNKSEKRFEQLPAIIHEGNSIKNMN